MATASAAERTPMTAAEIADALGGHWNGDSWSVRCPAHDDHDPSLSLTDRNGRTLVCCFAGCSQTTVIAALRERGLWLAAGAPRAVARTRSREGPATAADNRAAALRIWRDTQPAAGTIVEQYLRSRNIELSMMPKVLHYHPALRYAKSEPLLPAMVAAVRDISGTVVAIHRTYLRPDGTGKADVARPKKMLGPVRGGAVRLTEAGDQLAVGEGIETSLSVYVATGCPTWAALSAPGIAGLELPTLPLAAQVIVFADHDPAGIAAAEQAASRWHREGRSVRIALPPKAKTDFNDMLRGVA